MAEACYTPVALQRTDVVGQPLRNRPSTQLRPLFVKTAINSRADGSCYLESELLKVVCAVYGPRATNKPEYSERASLRCDVKLASFAEHGKRKVPSQTDAEAQLSALCASALEASLLVDKYPKSAIDVYVLVLEADGPVLAAAISAASLALADAGLQMRDLVAACSVAATTLPDASAALLLDPNAAEMVAVSQARGAVLTVSYMANLNRITQSALLQGVLPVAHSQRVLDLAVDACKKLATAMREALVAGAKVKAEIAAAQ